MHGLRSRGAPWKGSTACESVRPFARCKTTWSAASRACCGCSWAAIGAVLLIACATIANAHAVRADARRQEFAVRAARGAVPCESERIARRKLRLGCSRQCPSASGSPTRGCRFSWPRPETTCRACRRLRLSAGARVHRCGFARVDAHVRRRSRRSSTRCTSTCRPSVLPRGRAPAADGARPANTLVVVQVALAVVLVVSAAMMIRRFRRCVTSTRLSTRQPFKPRGSGFRRPRVPGRRAVHAHAARDRRQESRRSRASRDRSSRTRFR